MTDFYLVKVAHLPNNECCTNAQNPVNASFQDALMFWLLNRQETVTIMKMKLEDVAGLKCKRGQNNHE